LAIQPKKSALTTTERFDRFLSSGGGLDGLYQEILNQAYQEDDLHDLLPRFRCVMGRILALREPIALPTLCALATEEEALDDMAEIMRLIVRPLGSLLHGATDDSVALQPLHASFREFLENADRSRDFHVDIASQHEGLAMACFRVMDNPDYGLRFNICALETSYLPNAKVPDLAARCAKYIRPGLSYSCRFWGDHLQPTSSTQDMLVHIRSVLQDKLPFWLEALSIIGECQHAPGALTSLLHWIAVSFFPFSTSKFVDSGVPGPRRTIFSICAGCKHVCGTFPQDYRIQRPTYLYFCLTVHAQQ
jgi:hypothetical protein